MPFKDPILKKAWNKAYNALHKEDQKRRHKKWMALNPGRAKEHNRKYRRNHPDKDRLYYEKNREEIKKTNSAYKTNRLKIDPEFKLICNMRSRIKMALKNAVAGKSSRTTYLLGCTGLELKIYLENLWKYGMCWENYGTHGWHVDHIKPCAAFDLTDPQQQKVCFHYTNLQPLWAQENLTKSGKFVEAACV